MNRDIDYSQKIMTFKSLTDTSDDEIALNYLENFNWDEEVAAQKYFDDTSSRNDQGDRQVNREINRNNNEIRRGEVNSGLNAGGILNNMMNRMSEMINFGSLLNRPIGIDSDIYQPRQQVHSRPIQQNIPEAKNEVVNCLPFRAENLDDFYKNIKTKVGILFIYNARRDTEFIEHVIEKLLYETEAMAILEHQFVTYALLDSSKEAKSIIEKRKIKTPTCLFMYNPRNLDRSDSNIVIDKLEGQLEIDKLTNTILISLTTKEKVDENNLLNQNNQNASQYQGSFEDFGYDYGEEEDDSHAAIIRQQQEEMRQLERLEEENRKKAQLEEEIKRKKEKEERELLEKKKEEEKKREEMALFKRKQLPPEPPADEPNSTHILFRHPDGENRSERRFFKKDLIKDLYNYIESLQEVPFNNHAGKFDLIQPFPFINFTDKDKTLEEEKLFPNAVIQIREKET